MFNITRNTRTYHSGNGKVYTHTMVKTNTKRIKKTLYVLKEATWDKRLLMDLRVASGQCIYMAQDGNS